MKKGKKPELRPRKGWRYRVIICDKDGVIGYDDLGDLRTLQTWFYHTIGKLSNSGCK